MKSIPFFVVISFFLFFPIYLMIGFKALDFSFAFLLLCVLFFLIFNASLNSKVFCFLFLMFSYLCVFLIIGFFVNDNFLISTKQFMYYLKFLLFFISGYLFFNLKQYSKLMVIVFWISFIGTCSFIFFESKMINETMKYLEINEYGYFYSFGLFVRNISFFISPLEFGALSFYLLFYFSYVERFRNNLINFYIAVSFLMMILTLSRTMWIVTALTFLMFYLSDMKTFNKLCKKSLLVFIFLFVAVFILYFNFSFVDKYFISDGSSSTHHSNAFETIMYLIEYPFGLGLGASGWAGYDYNLKYYHYSEGSLLANMIELGTVQCLLFLIVFSSYVYSLNKNVFIIFIGYLVACLIIPIGFSTFINLLLFLMLGILTKGKNGKV